jgi:polar amino acid transport system substrate-binding protein
MKNFKSRNLAAALITTLACWSVTVEARNLSGVTVEWAPHYGSTLKDGGALTVITKEAFRRAGHNAEISFIPWNRALKDVEEGKEDFVMGAYFNDERSKTYVFSDSVYDVEVSIVGLDDTGVTSYNSLDDLKQYTFGVSRGYANSEGFDSAEYLNKEVSKSPELNIRKLFRNRIDFAVGARDILAYEAKSQNFNTSRLKFLSPPLQSNGLYLMASRSIPDGEEIIDGFNSALSEMRADGTFQRLLREYLSRQ